MKLLLCMALILNLIVCICEIYTLGNLKVKLNILKYYTFLQNFLALLASIVLSLSLAAAIFLDYVIPEFVRGIHYITTCGLTATMVIFVVFLSSNHKNLLSEEDFLSINPEKANFILHYFCPLISILSFVVFEREIALTNGLWTSLASLPSCVYWVAYMILSIAKLWEEPYDFSSGKEGKKSVISEVLTIVLLPVIFILVSYILWTII